MEAGLPGRGRRGESLSSCVASLRAPHPLISSIVGTWTCESWNSVSGCTPPGPRSVRLWQPVIVCELLRIEGLPPFPCVGGLPPEQKERENIHGFEEEQGTPSAAARADLVGAPSYQPSNRPTNLPNGGS